MAGGHTAATGSPRRPSSATCPSSTSPTGSSPTDSRRSGPSTSPPSSSSSSPRRTSRKSWPFTTRPSAATAGRRASTSSSAASGRRSSSPTSGRTRTSGCGSCTGASAATFPGPSPSWSATGTSRSSPAPPPMATCPCSRATSPFTSSFAPRWRRTAGTSGEPRAASGCPMRLPPALRVDAADWSRARSLRQVRPGLEEMLAQHGIEYFVADAHLVAAGTPVFPYRDYFALPGTWRAAPRRSRAPSGRHTAPTGSPRGGRPAPQWPSFAIPGRRSRCGAATTATRASSPISNFTRSTGRAD